MPDRLAWNGEQVSQAMKDLDAASGEISGKTVESPSGCGWSASSAATVVSNLQSGLSSLQTNIPVNSSNLSTANTTMRDTDEAVASGVPSAERG